MYTPAQVSEMLGLPASTLRHYAQLFAAHLSNQTGRRHRLYSERDLVIITKVIELSKAGKPMELIGPLLDVIEAPDLEGLGAAQSSLSLVPGIAREIETAQNAARSALSQLASLQSAMGSQNEKIDQLAADLAAQLAAQNARIKELDNYLSTPWYKRLFKRHPRI